MFPRPVASRDEGKIFRIATGATGAVLACIVDTLDGEVRLFEAATLAPRGAIMLGAARTVRGCAVSPNDSLLAAATDDDLTLFDLNTRAARWTVPGPGDEPAVAFSPNGATIALGTSAGHVALIKTDSGAVTATVETTEEARIVAWDALGLMIASPHALVLCDARGGSVKTLEAAGGEDEAREIATMDGGRFAVAGSGAGQGVGRHPGTGGRRTSIRSLMLDGDQRAEGVAFAGDVLFVATEGGTYRADPPFEQLTRWLPPLGGAHDPTRLTAVVDSHVAVSARDLRVFRTRS